MASSAKLEFKGLAEEVVSLLRAHPLHLLLPLVLLGALTGGDGRGGGGRLRLDDLSTGEILLMLPLLIAIGILGLAIIVLILIVTAVLWYVTARAALDATGGTTPDVMRAFRDAKPHLTGSVLTFLLFIVLALVGFVFLLLPGVFLLAAWAPWIAIVVAEGKTGPAALGRAWAMTKDNWGTLFLLVLVGILAAAIASAVVGWLPIIGGALSGAIMGAFEAAYVVLGVVVYRRLSEATAPAAAPVTQEPPNEP